MTTQVPENQNNGFFKEMTQTTEERLGPPKIDWTGILLMSFVAIFCGFLSSVGVLILAFFFIGRFSLESGATPLLLAIFTLIALLLASLLYIWAARTMFPYIYTRNRLLYMQVSLFNVLVFICLIPVYLIVWSRSGMDTQNILYVYLAHILLIVFGLELLSSMITQYRYVLLSFYANFIALIFTGGIILWFSKSASISGIALFILMLLSILAFALSTFLIFFIKYLYYQYYKSTGNDTLGNVFGSIEEIESASLKTIEKELLKS